MLSRKQSIGSVKALNPITHVSVEYGSFCTSSMIVSCAHCSSIYCHRLWIHRIRCFKCIGLALRITWALRSHRTVLRHTTHNCPESAIFCTLCKREAFAVTDRVSTFLARVFALACTFGAWTCSCIQHVGLPEKSLVSEGLKKDNASLLGKGRNNGQRKHHTCGDSRFRAVTLHFAATCCSAS